MKPHFFILFLTLLQFSCTSAPSKTGEEKETVPPNVLFIAIDDLNDWLGCMKGHPNAKTPNIDRLAAQGTLFTNAHCQAPICGPSRASLMSGLRPSTTGIYGQISDKNIQKANAATEKVTFLPAYFGQHGYKTMGVGKLFHKFAPKGVFEEEGGREAGFGPKPEKRFKYDPEWFGKPGGTQTDWGVYPERDDQMPDYRTAQWAIEHLKQEHDRPFFLAVGFLRPHVPWYVPQKWFDLHPLDSIQLPPYLKDDQADVPEISRQVHSVPMMPTAEWAKKEGEWKAAIQAYLACISFVDHYVGLVLDALEQSAYAQNTIVVLWSDHGYHIGEKNRFAKHSLWEEATHVPIIFSVPGFPKNQQCSKPIELLDLYPSLVDLCGLPANTQNEGKSVRPLLEDPEADWDKVAITTYGWNNHAIRSEDYRYMIYEDGSEEFYNHQNDPSEWKNEAARIDYENVKAKLKVFFPQANEDWAFHSNSGVGNNYMEALREAHLSEKKE